MGVSGLGNTPEEEYCLLREIGRGGMGVVYEAWDVRLERRVAVKVLHPKLLTEPGARERLLREAKLAARVAHPNVVRIYRVHESTCDTWTMPNESGTPGETATQESDGLPGLAIEMEFVEGYTLGELLVGRGFSGAQAADLLQQILAGLGACHEKGVVHCDLKPSNLLVTASGHVFLTDFGISQGISTGRRFSARFAGVTVQDTAEGAYTTSWGTPGYAPPEAWLGDAPTAQFDLYGAGVIAVEALCGQRLYCEATSEAMLREKRDPTRVRAIIAGLEISSSFKDLLCALLDPNPAGRPSDAHAAIDRLGTVPELLSANQDTQQLRPSGEAPNTGVLGKHGGRQSLFRVAAVAVTFLLLGSFGIWYTVPQPQVSVHGIAATNPAGTARVDMFTEVALTPNFAFFPYDDGFHGRELWAVSRVTNEVRRITDIAPGLASSNPRRFWPQGGSLYFAATSPEFGEELWITHRTMHNGFHDYRLLKDIAPGAMGSAPQPVASVSGRVLFFACTLEHGRQIWCTAGRSNLTAMIDVLGPVDAPTESPSVIADDKGAYFWAYAGLEPKMTLLHYLADSHTIRDIKKVSMHASGEMGLLNETLLFDSFDAEKMARLWIHNPAESSIRMLPSKRANAAPQNPASFFTWKNVVLFQASSESNGDELWISDGTDVGTRLLKDINPGPDSSRPYDFTVAGELVFFRAFDAVHSQELWVTDGTAEGTRIAADTWPGRDSGTPYNLSFQGTHLFYTATDGIHGEELWAIDPADPELVPRLVADLWPGPKSAEPHNLQWWNEDEGIFVAWAPGDVQRLYRISRAEQDWTITPVALPGQDLGGDS